MLHMVDWKGSVKSGICQWTPGQFLLMLPKAHSFKWLQLAQALQIARLSKQNKVTRSLSLKSLALQATI